MTEELTPEEERLAHAFAHGYAGPVICYVNCLLVGMCRTTDRSRTIRIRQSEPMPPQTPLHFTEPIETSDYSKVINRLKIMSDLNPITYQEPMEGRFSLTALGKEWQARVHFEDTADDPWFSLTLEEEKGE